MTNTDRFKFRTWDKTSKILSHFSLTEIMKDSVETLPTGLFAMPIEDQIIMQWIGRKDKNGELVYEGDVLEYIQVEQKEHYEVVFRNGCYGIINIVGGNLSNFLTLGEFILEMKNDLEIIGNIYENPELLTQSKLT